MSGEVYGCSGCATSGGRMVCPHHGPQARSVTWDAFNLHPHQWRTDSITDGWLFAIQTCAVSGCGAVRRVKIEDATRERAGPESS